MTETDDDAATSTATGPLAGLRVLDIATVYAAPFAATILGDLGADVLKVELPGTGDPLRALQPFEGEESLVWAAMSRNKRCITLDLRTPRGHELLLRLLADRDVLFENFRPGTLDKWGLGIDELRSVNPKLVVVRVSGFGHTGPHREHAGFGTPATAFSGFTHISGFPDRPPILPPISLTDYVTGLFATIGSLAALYHRDALDGDAQEVDAALYESMFRLLETMVAQYDRLGVVQERLGNRLTASVPAGVFKAGDGVWMVLTTSTERTFKRLASVIGRRDMLGDPRYATNRARVEHRDEVDGIVGDWFGAHDAETIQQRCDANGVPVSRILDIADIFADPHYAARDMLVEVDHPTLGQVRLPGVVPRFTKTPGQVRTSGARLGEHNTQVYRALGLSDQEISELSEEGVI
ncbi:MAG: CoA transferase [Streptosporangiales bacterium]|nr:CoA transferase [Streptosporangiales bacterium]